MADPAEALGLRRDQVDDYRSSPSARWAPDSVPPATVRVLTVLGALLVGFLIGTGVTAGRSVAVEQTERRAELVQLIGARQEHTTVLAAQLEELRGRVTEAEENLAGGVPVVKERVAQLELAAGLVGVTGPGVRLTFADATGQCPTGRTEDCRIQDVDLQLAVNLLFDSGAEAVAVNGERVIATTAIRRAGGAVLANYRVLTSPYVVEAVGDPRRLAARFETSDLARDFEVWSDVYGLGFSLEQADDVVLPAFSGSVRLRAATIAEEQR
jgi:uncharacterized protein YlxW (UPF0749 family)